MKAQGDSAYAKRGGRRGQRFPWLPLVIGVVAALVVIGAIVVAALDHLRFF